MSNRIYLDHAATSPLRPEAKAAMEEGFALWANPSSPHAEGRKAKQALEDARERIKAVLGWDGEVIFTSGASEAAAIALNRAKLGDRPVERRIVSVAEHDAVFSGAGTEIDALLPMKGGGYPDYGDFYEALGVIGTKAADERPPSLLCLQHVNSETGSIFDAGNMRQLFRNFREALMLCDCSQSAGKMPLPPISQVPEEYDNSATPDMMIVSAHKLGGPIGIGALLVKDFNLLEPSTGHERGYRRGTENMPAAMGLAAALEAGDWRTSPEERAEFWRELGEARLTFDKHVDFIGAVTHPKLSAQALLIRLDAMGFAVSAGSACSSGTLKKSRVLDAFGVPDDVAARTIRVSLGWSTTADELEQFAEAWKSLV